MTYFIALFLTCFSFLAPSLVSANTTLSLDAQQHFTYTWTGNDNELYLNIALNKGLKFSQKYQRITHKNGQSCVVSCTPAADANFVSEEGYPLEKITLTASVTNITGDPNNVSYTIISEKSYKGKNENGQNVTVTDTYQINGRLKNPSIDLNQKPLFSLMDEASEEGMVSFTNSFPYSKIR